jgi:hypothetical protein
MCRIGGRAAEAGGRGSAIDGALVIARKANSGKAKNSARNFDDGFKGKPQDKHTAE